MERYSTPQVDPITVQVIRNALVAIAEEMQSVTVRTAYNPLLYEIQDFGVGLLTAEGETLAQGTSLPIFLGCLPATIQNGLRKFGPNQLRSGDVIIANDPYTTGTHVSDVAIYLPIFYDGQLQAFSINMAHWADIGGKSPGGWCPDTIDVYQEGMIFPYLKLYDAGQINEMLIDFILANTRYPDLVQGDLAAQIASCKIGAERYLALCHKYGAGTVRQAMEIVFDQSEALVRRKLGQVPAGAWSAETSLDHDGIIKDRPRKVKVMVRIGRGEIEVDFAGTDETAVGPINMPLIAARACVEMAFKSAFVPFDPPNAGHSRPLTVVAPENTLVNPSWPAPCDSYGYIGILITDLVSEALSYPVPDRCAAGEYMLWDPYFFRTDRRYGEPFIAIDILDGGGGALPYDDGANGLIFQLDGDAPNVPVEVAETRYPLRIERFELNTAEYGIGKYRGGLGVIREYRLLTDQVYLQHNGELTICRPHGLHGGRDAGIGQAWVHPGSEQARQITDRVSYYGPLQSGDRVHYRTGGGGGYGPPLERDADRVRWEVLNEIISAEQAEKLYGVIIGIDAHGDPAVDIEATRAYRQRCRTDGTP